MRTHMALLGAMFMSTPGCGTLDTMLTPPVSNTSFTTGASVMQPPDDPVINAAVARDIGNDPTIPLYAVGVETNLGVVQLTGNVPDILAKERAHAIAETIAGVRSVVDRINVVPITREDVAIGNDIANALHSDSVARRFHLKSDVQDGVVTLTGTVDSLAAAGLVEDVVKSVSGVRSVDDRITIVPRKRSDAEIEAEVKRSLDEDVWIDASLTNVHVKNGVVTVSGIVGRARDAAEVVRVLGVAGVKRVDVNGLRVDSWTRRVKQRPSPELQPARSDQELQASVLAAFTNDPRVFPNSTAIGVQDRVVTLTGIARDVRARDAAVADARATAGVRDVVDLIHIEPMALPTDSELSRRLQEVFRGDTRLRDSPINIALFRGRVVLTGVVPSEAARDEATHIAARTDGVIAVTNELTVRVPPRVPPRAP